MLWTPIFPGIDNIQSLLKVSFRNFRAWNITFVLFVAFLECLKSFTTIDGHGKTGTFSEVERLLYKSTITRDVRGDISVVPVNRDGYGFRVICAIIGVIFSLGRTIIHKTVDTFI